MLAAQLLLALGLLLGTTDVELLSVGLGLVQGVASNGSLAVGGEVDEAKAPGLASLVSHDDGGDDLAVGGKELLELGVGQVLIKVLHKDIGEVLLELLVLGRALPPRDVEDNEDLLLVQEHAVNLGDGELGSLGSLEVNEAETAGGGALVDHDLAGEDVAEGAESVVEGLVVDAPVEVLDEDVADTGPAEGGVTLGPHDASGPALDHMVVQGVQSALSVVGGVEVHIGIAERAKKKKRRGNLVFPRKSRIENNFR